MTMVNGVPAHAVLLHFVVALVPLTALLEIVCGLWPPARRGQLMWHTLILASVTMVLTPVTANAGMWLYKLTADPTPLLREHAARGSTMTYFAAALLAAAIGLAVLRASEHRSEKPHVILQIMMGIVVLVVGTSSMIQIYRVADTGGQSVWNDEIARMEMPRELSK